jgi:hypothetical protein
LGIHDVEVTAYHGDKGIDATGIYELAPALTASLAVRPSARPRTSSVRLYRT